MLCYGVLWHAVAYHVMAVALCQVLALDDQLSSCNCAVVEQRTKIMVGILRTFLIIVRCQSLTKIIANNLLRSG